MSTAMGRACAGLFLGIVSMLAEAAPGDWDQSYGVNGRLALTVPGVAFTVENWEPRADGRFVTSGRVSALGHPVTEYVVARFNADGTPDVSFDGDGVVRFDFGVLVGGGVIEHALLPDGRLLVIANSNATTLSLRRLNVDGSLDATFGTAGQLTLSYPDFAAEHAQLKLAPDGSAIVVARATDLPDPARVLISRVTTDGALDLTFGANGYAPISSPGTDLAAYSVVVQSNGAIVLGGTLGAIQNGAPYVARLTANGQADVSFGTGGIAIPSFLEGKGAVVDVAVTADGKIYAAGERGDSVGGTQRFVARFNVDGTLDTAFGTDGRIIVPAQTLTSIAAQADGKLLVSGSINELRPGLGWLARYNTDGSPDPAFGVAGRTRIDVSQGSTPSVNLLYQVRQDADGGFRALVSADTNLVGFTYGLVRFVADGSNPGVFGVRAIGELAASGHTSLRESNTARLVSVYRVGGADGVASVQYRTVGQTATAGEDFTDTSGTLSFGPGEVIKQVSVPILDDRLAEGGESFYFELFGATGGATLARERATFTITSDGDPGASVTFLTRTHYIKEGAGTVRLLVERTGDLIGPLTVSYTTSDSSNDALAGADFVASTGTVSWAANEGGVRAIDIALLDDGNPEPMEVFGVALSSDDPVALIDFPASIFIRDDDDVLAAPTIGFVTSNVAVAENAGTVALEARRFGDLSQPLSATWALQGGSATAADYSNVNGSLTWGAGDAAAKIITVPITNDAVIEITEYFNVILTPDSPATAHPGLDQVRVNIADNDTAAALPVINIGAVSVDEHAGTATIPVTLSAAPAFNVSVNHSISYETATSADLSSIAGTLSWLAGDASPRQVVIPITNDTIDEIDETFVVNLGNLQGVGARLGVASARITILDEDPTPAGQSAPTAPRLIVTPGAVTVSESARSVRLNIALSSPIGPGLSLSYTGVFMDGASSPGDFINPTGAITVPGGGTLDHSVEIQLNGDSMPEPDETFAIRFTANAPGVPLAPVDAVITINDDDEPGAVTPATIEFVSATESVGENQTSVTLQVARSGNTALASSVEYVTAAGTATAADYSMASGTLSWEANDTSAKLITIALTPDTTDEPDESFTVLLRNPSAGTEVGTASASVTIVDDDVPPAGPNNPDPAPSGGGNAGGGGGGGPESLIALLLWAALVTLRLSARARNKPLSR